MSLTWPFKDPDEVLDYDVDWTMRLYSATELAAFQALVDAGSTEADALAAVVPADTIATSAFHILSPAGSLVAQSTSNTTTATKVWLIEGDDGTTIEITNEITTAGGRTMDQTIKLKVKSK